MLCTGCPKLDTDRDVLRNTSVYNRMENCLLPGDRYGQQSHLTDKQRTLGSKENLVKTRNRQLKSKGQLRLTAYFNTGLLTVHILEARRLLSAKTGSRDICVKLVMYPDSNTRSSCRTENKHFTTNAIFDEKFSFELLEGDGRKRLQISVWQTSASGKNCKCLGSMSFGLRHIITNKKIINGWYYLLPEDVGKRKHLQAPGKIHLLPSKEKQQMTEPSREQGWLESHVFVIRHCDYGYGFGLIGDDPVMISSIKPDSPASSSGLQQQDYVTRINGFDVSHGNAESVARIIKMSKKQIVLEVYRVKADLVQPSSLESAIKTVPETEPEVIAEAVSSTKERNFPTSISDILYHHHWKDPGLIGSRGATKDEIYRTVGFQMSS